MLNKLIKLAESLDARGFYAEADLVDEILKIAIEDWQYHGFKSKKDFDNFRELRGLKPSEEKPEEVKEPKKKEFGEERVSSISLTDREQEILNQHLYGGDFDITYASYPLLVQLCKDAVSIVGDNKYAEWYITVESIYNKLKAYAKKYYDTIYDENDFDYQWR